MNSIEHKERQSMILNETKNQNSISKSQICNSNTKYTFNNSIKGSLIQTKHFQPEVGLHEELQLTQKTTIDSNEVMCSLRESRVLSQKSFKKILKEDYNYDPNANKDDKTTGFFHLLEKEVEEAL